MRKGPAVKRCPSEKLEGVIDSKGRNTFNRTFSYRGRGVGSYITSGVFQLSTASGRVAFGHSVGTVEGYAMGIADALDTDTNTGCTIRSSVVGMVLSLEVIPETFTVTPVTGVALPCAQSFTSKPKS